MSLVLLYHCWPQIGTQSQIPGWKMVQCSCSTPWVLRAWCLSQRDRQHGRRIDITVDCVHRLVSMIFLATWMACSCLRISPPLVHRGLHIVHVTYPPYVFSPSPVWGQWRVLAAFRQVGRGFKKEEAGKSPEHLTWGQSGLSLPMPSLKDGTHWPVPRWPKTALRLEHLAHIPFQA